MDPEHGTARHEPASPGGDGRTHIQTLESYYRHIIVRYAGRPPIDLKEERALRDRPLVRIQLGAFRKGSCRAK